MGCYDDSRVPGPRVRGLIPARATALPHALRVLQFAPAPPDGLALGAVGSVRGAGCADAPQQGGTRAGPRVRGGGLWPHWHGVVHLLLDHSAGLHARRLLQPGLVGAPGNLPVAGLQRALQLPHVHLHASWRASGAGAPLLPPHALSPPPHVPSPPYAPSPPPHAPSSSPHTPPPHHSGAHSADPCGRRVATARRRSCWTTTGATSASRRSQRARTTAPCAAGAVLQAPASLASLAARG